MASMQRRQLTYPLCLLTGALLIIVAGMLHPDLHGDGAAQLMTIGHSDAWRAVHWAFLFGFALCLTGLAGLVTRHMGTPGEGAVRAAIVVGAFAYAMWAIIVSFMAGTGWVLAQNYLAAEPGMTATRAIFLYDMSHPFGLATQRLAGFALGISTYLFGWGVVQGRVLPRWVGWSGVASGIVAIALATLFHEATKADQAAFVLPVIWQFVTAAVLLAGRRLAKA